MTARTCLKRFNSLPQKARYAVAMSASTHGAQLGIRPTHALLAAWHVRGGPTRRHHHHRPRLRHREQGDPGRSETSDRPRPARAAAVGLPPGRLVTHEFTVWADPVVPDASGSVRAVENPRYPTTPWRTLGGRGAGHRLADVQPVRLRGVNQQRGDDWRRARRHGRGQGPAEGGHRRPAGGRRCVGVPDGAEAAASPWPMRHAGTPRTAFRP